MVGSRSALRLVVAPLLGMALGCAQGPRSVSVPPVLPAVEPAGAPATPVAKPRELVTMGIGFHHGCALRGVQVWCWGRRAVGRDIDDLVGPTRVRLPPVADLVVNRSGACAVLTSGEAQCWGRVPGSLTSGPAPLFGVEDVRHLRFDERSFCALQRGGEVVCKDVNAESWTRIGLPPLVAIDAGREGYCGLAEDGAVHRWRAWQHRGARAHAFPAGASAVACGMGATCALYPEGKVRCVDERPVGHPVGRRPMRELPVDDVRELHLSENNACLLRRDGSVWCWGDTRLHRLSEAGGSFVHEPTRLKLPALSRLFLGSWNLCGVGDEGRLRCVGSDAEGQLGRGPYRARAAKVEGVPPVRRIIATGRERCVLLRSDELRCWGEQGERRQPATRATTGHWSTCIVGPRGNVRCREGFFDPDAIWTPIVGLPEVTELHGIGIGGEDISEVFLARTKRGEVYTWGSRTFSPAKRLRLGPRRFDQVGGGYAISLALAGGDLWAWPTERHVLGEDQRPITIEAERIARGVKRLEGACFQAEDDSLHCVSGTAHAYPATPVVRAVAANERGSDLDALRGRAIALPEVDGLPSDIEQVLDPCVLTKTGELWCWPRRGEAHPADEPVEIRF